MQSVEASLRVDKSLFSRSWFICGTCGAGGDSDQNNRNVTHAAGCTQAKFPNYRLGMQYCTAETRIAEYFETIRRLGLWPTARPFRSQPIADIISRIDRISEDENHRCRVERGCPLLQNLERLLLAVRKIDESIKGLCLSCIKGGEKDTESEEIRCSCSCKS